MPPDQTGLSGFRAQFRNPTGVLGRIAGSLMVIANGRMNRFVVEMLDVQATLDSISSRPKISSSNHLPSRRPTSVRR
jgi:hypothetical protein